MLFLFRFCCPIIIIIALWSHYSLYYPINYFFLCKTRLHECEAIWAWKPYSWLATNWPAISMHAYTVATETAYTVPIPVTSSGCGSKFSASALELYLYCTASIIDITPPSITVRNSVFVKSCKTRVFKLFTDRARRLYILYWSSSWGAIWTCAPTSSESFWSSSIFCLWWVLAHGSGKRLIPLLFRTQPSNPAS